jgi:hypothetical protein
MLVCNVVCYMFHRDGLGSGSPLQYGRRLYLSEGKEVRRDL